MAKLEKSITKKNDELEQQERSLRENSEKSKSIQSQIENLHIELAEIKTEIKNVYQNFIERHSRDLAEFESGMDEIDTPIKKLRANLSIHRDELRNLGHVNLMAPEEFPEVNERYKFLADQLEDLKAAEVLGVQGRVGGGLQKVGEQEQGFRRKTKCFNREGGREDELKD